MCFAPQRRALFRHLNFQKWAPRHNGVQFFISHLASWLRTRRFSEPTCRPSGATNHWKNQEFRDFPTFSRICIFFLLTLLSSNLSLLSASSLLCFSSVHIVGSLTSKLPSTKEAARLQYEYRFTYILLKHMRVLNFLLAVCQLTCLRKKWTDNLEQKDMDPAFNLYCFLSFYVCICRML